ncbi:hypothetical protein AVEN_246571-1 [Araneus ventricosus]|uniref:C2H2-type domain-containing protein n=1 Tax=Araneus ventricosus TaxID=182803 RepID=A0A4Y2DCA9_ARAVE|nr:hypothetical protein AVEN_246571-1 [Araneus ventricosus]
MFSLFLRFIDLRCGSLFSHFHSSDKRDHPRDHLLTLSGEKPHACPKRFSQEAHLRTHLLLHTGQKEHSCGKRFARKDYLMAHERVHSGERPYRCPDRASHLNTRPQPTGDTPANTGSLAQVISLDRSVSPQLPSLRKGIQCTRRTEKAQHPEAGN